MKFMNLNKDLTKLVNFGITNLVKLYFSKSQLLFGQYK